MSGAAAETRTLERLIGLVVFLSCAYFNNGAGANQNARLDAIFSFVEPGTPDSGTFRIDRFLPDPEHSINTVDWAYFRGRHYANKAPGTILLGTVVYSALYHFERVIAVPVDMPLVQLINAYLINVAVSIVPIALAAVAFFRLLLARASARAAALLTLGVFLGTALFPYATQLWGHGTAGAFLVIAIYQLRRATPRADALGGCFLAAALATDYLTALAVAFIGLAFLVARPRGVLRAIAGALPALLAMLGYHAACFGSPFALATSFSNPAFLDSRRTLGLFGSLDLGALYQLTFGPARGVFVHTPIALLGIMGFAAWFRRDRRDPWLWACLCVGLGGFLSVASFNGWDGGLTICARYLIPFVAVAMLSVQEIEWTMPRLALGLGVAALSVFNMLAVTAVNPLAGLSPNPIYGLIYAHFFAGHIAPFIAPIRLLDYDPSWRQVARSSMWNGGTLLGLQGFYSLFPLLAGWGLGLVAVLRMTRSPRRSDDGGSGAIPP